MDGEFVYRRRHLKAEARRQLKKKIAIDKGAKVSAKTQIK